MCFQFRKPRIRGIRRIRGVELNNELGPGHPHPDGLTILREWAWNRCWMDVVFGWWFRCAKHCYISLYFHMVPHMCAILMFYCYCSDNRCETNMLIWFCIPFSDDDPGMMFYHTLKYEVSRIPTPLGVNSRVLEWCSGSILELWPPPIVEPWRFGFLELLFLCRNLPLRQLQIFMDHVEVDTWKAWCPSFLGTVQSARNFGHWKAYHFRSMISTCIYGTVRELTAILNLSKHGAPSDEVLFLCKNCNVTHNRLQGRRSLKQ